MENTITAQEKVVKICHRCSYVIGAVMSGAVMSGAVMSHVQLCHG
jgi:hypothetical protein